MARLASGDGPLSVRGCPSSVKGTEDPFKTASQKASSGPALERRSLCTPSGSETKGQAEPARTGRGPSPARCGRSGVPTFVRNHRRRARCVPDRPVNAGKSQSLAHSGCIPSKTPQAWRSTATCTAPAISEASAEFGISIHGIWTFPEDEAPRLYVLTSFPADADPVQIERDYMQSPASRPPWRASTGRTSSGSNDPPRPPPTHPRCASRHRLFTGPVRCRYGGRGGPGEPAAPLLVPRTWWPCGPGRLATGYPALS